MKVREFITFLSKIDQEIEVYVQETEIEYNDEHQDFTDFSISDVSFEGNEGKDVRITSESIMFGRERRVY